MVAVLENLATLVRERLNMAAKLKAHTAHIRTEEALGIQGENQKREIAVAVRASPAPSRRWVRASRTMARPGASR